MHGSGGRCRSPRAMETWRVQRNPAPQTKNILIDYQALSRFSGFDDFESFHSAYLQWVQSALSDDRPKREDHWTQCLATGSRSFVEAVRKQMRSSAIDRHVRKKVEGFELWESQIPYKAFFDTEKIDIAEKNIWFWNEYKWISLCWLGPTLGPFPTLGPRRRASYIKNLLFSADFSQLQGWHYILHSV